MGLHQRHTHGRVFRGEAAREQLHARKRDSHDDRIRLHVPEGFPQQQSNNNNGAAAVSVVYVTLPQTFSGAAIYSTLTGGLDTPTTAAAAATATNNAQASYDSSRSAAQAGHKTTSASTSIATVVPTQSSSSAIAMTTFATSSVGPSVIVGSPVRAGESASATAAPEQSQHEMSGGAKAGLAFGIILAIALVGGLIYFFWRKQQNRSHQELLNEKHNSFADVSARRAEAGGHAPTFAAAAVPVINKRNSSMTEKVPESIRSSRTASTAPRLSLRPVTQFLPNLGENRKSNGNTLDFGNNSNSSWERNLANNPFDEPRRNSPPSNPFDEPERYSHDSQSRAAAAGATAAAATVAATSATGAKHTPKSSWEGSEAGTPRNAQFAAGGAPGPRQPNNVHRVQLDFKPSMDDELELRSGQLVRLLHEYDDGWALCIRMDRSQQGVTPRTCLSKLPVKPRPGGPPPKQQGSRPGTAQSSRSDIAQDPRRPSNASAPAGINGGMVPRPLTPTQAGRIPSPASQPTQRKGESATSPTGVPARKPVPGQAM